MSQVLLYRRFQITLLSVLLYHSVTKPREKLDGLNLAKAPEVDYLLLPYAHPTQDLIDWESVISVLYQVDDHICQNHSKVSSSSCKDEKWPCFLLRA